MSPAYTIQNVGLSAVLVFFIVAVGCQNVDRISFPFVGGSTDEHISSTNGSEYRNG